MKQLFALVLLLAACAAPLRGQTIALGEKAPDLKAEAWLGEQPAAAPLTYIEFFHTQAAQAERSLAHLAGLCSIFGPQLRVAVVSREDSTATARVVDCFRAQTWGVVLDPPGRLFAACGARYLPFGVLVDDRNRVVWQGNTLHLKPETVAGVLIAK